jgi:hypothetical protein
VIVPTAPSAENVTGIYSRPPMTTLLSST